MYKAIGQLFVLHAPRNPFEKYAGALPAFGSEDDGWDQETPNLSGALVDHQHRGAFARHDFALSVKAGLFVSATHPEVVDVGIDGNQRSSLVKQLLG